MNQEQQGDDPRDVAESTELFESSFEYLLEFIEVQMQEEQEEEKNQDQQIQRML